MIGCMLLAAAGLFVAARVVHGRRYGFGGHCGGGWGHGRRWGHHRHGFGHHHHHGPGPGGWGHFGEPEGDDEWGGGGGYGPGEEWGGGGRGGMGFFVRGLASRLDATPAQEEVLRRAVDELREAGGKLKGEGKKTRADLAAAFRRGSLDEVAMGELYARHDRGLEELRKAFVGAGARIHDALDEKQRARLADLIEKGPRWFGRSWARRDW